MGVCLVHEPHGTCQGIASTIRLVYIGAYVAVFELSRDSKVSQDCLTFMSLPDGSQLVRCEETLD